MANQSTKKPTTAKTTKSTATKTVEYQPVGESAEQGDNPLAITSMVLGVVSLTSLGPITGVPAVILGIIGLNKPGKKGLSIAGIITGGISILITILVIAFILLVFVFAVSDAGYYDIPVTDMPAPSKSIYHET